MRPSNMFAAAGLALSVAGVARGQVISWAAPVSGSWGAAANWSPMNVPDSPGESPVLGMAGPYAVTVAGNAYSIGALTISNPMAELRIDASDAIGHTALHIHQNMSSSGLVRLTSQPSANNARFQINANGLTIDGTGELRMEEAADCDFYINVGGGGSFVNGIGHRITGAGTIQGGGCTLTNNGAILANLAGGMTILNNINNNGTLRAAGPGSIRLISGSTVNQAGLGLVEADGATITLDNATIVGNTARAVNGGLIAIGPSGGAISAITAEGPWEVLASDAVGHTVLYMGNSVTDNGLIRLPAAASANNARFQVNANGLTLGGTGEVRMEEAADCDFYINVGGGGSFVNGAAHTISGTGTITGGGCTLTNNGTILANRAGGMTIVNHISNSGTLRTVSPGALTLAGTTTVTQSGAGVVEADNAVLTLDNATITGNTARAVNGGLISVGPSGGVINAVTAEGNWQVLASDAVGHTVLYMGSSVTNNGLIRLPAAGSANNARFQVNLNGQTLGGTGEVRMEEAADCDFYINVGGGGSFVNGAAHTISGTGTITGGGCTLTNNGTILANRAGGMTIVNHINNNGTLRAVAPGAMTLAGTTTVTQAGAGVVEADNTVLTLNNATIIGNTARAVNGGLVAVGPSGATVGAVTVEGDWRIEASDSAAFTTLVMTTGITNNGLIRMPTAGTANNARFQINNNGQTLGGTGEIRMEDAADADFYINVGGGGSFTNGPGHTISGAGTITGGGCALTNAGILAPGAPLGTLRVINAVAMQATGVVEIEVGGDAASQRDYLDATGSSFVLGGTLRVRFRDGYTLPACSSFVVIRGNLSGVFSVEDLPVMPQGVISVSYGVNTVTIGYIPGDLNGDGLLDFGDYLQFLNLYDAQDIRADLNGDGLVDFSDYLEFLNLYDAGC